MRSSSSSTGWSTGAGRTVSPYAMVCTYVKSWRAEICGKHAGGRLPPHPGRLLARLSDPPGRLGRGRDALRIARTAGSR